jgi:hypothetical protein
MTSKGFLDEMLRMEKITQERYDKGILKLEARQQAKDKFKTNKDKLTKDELRNILEIIIGSTDDQ